MGLSFYHASEKKTMEKSVLTDNHFMLDNEAVSIGFYCWVQLNCMRMCKVISRTFIWCLDCFKSQMIDFDKWNETFFSR